MLIRPAALAAALTLACAGAASAQTSNAQTSSAQSPAADAFHATTLHLTASGEIHVKPDMAQLVAGVSSEAPSAQAAMAQTTAKMNAVIAALRAHGVAADDIQTTGLSLNAQYRYEPNQPPERTGYQATNLVTVKIRALARVGATLDAVVAAGANEVRGVSFDLADRTAAEDRAREAAVRALQAKADLYARATGYRVLRLVSLGEGGARIVEPFAPKAAMLTARAESVPVSGGELTVAETVSGVYELGR
jgi:hypothetical protein